MNIGFKDLDYLSTWNKDDLLF